jgi:hypothetical protein
MDDFQRDLQERLDDLGFLPGDVRFEQPRTAEEVLDDLQSDPEVSDIRVSTIIGTSMP